MTLFWICLVAMLVVFGIDTRQKQQNRNIS
jgi:hypothetical protein